MTETETNPEVVAIREAMPGDMNFIYATWLRDLRHSDGSPLPDDLFFPAWRELVTRVLSDEKVSVLVVHPTDAPSEILGYIVAEQNEVLWNLYVKPKFRGHKLAKRLLQAAKAEGAVAAWTTPAAKLRLKNRRRPRQLRSRYAASGSKARPRKES